MNISLLISLLFLYSCRNTPKLDQEEVVEKWVGRKIIIPDVPCYSYDKRVSDSIFNYKAHHKILYYVDNEGCLNCNLRLGEWHDYISYIDSISSHQVSFLIYISPNKTNEAIRILKFNRFSFPVFIDETDRINIINKFPIENRFHTFLLDSNNVVLAIDNPIYSKSIASIYESIITSQN